MARWITPEKRLAIYLRDNFTCLYCLADLHDAAATDITLDHLVCRVDGGSNEHTNLVVVCRHCNCSRQDTPLSRFAGPETRKHIRRNTRRSLEKYIALAKDILSCEFNHGDESK